MQTVIRVSDPRVVQKWDADVSRVFNTFPGEVQLFAADGNRTVVGISFSLAGDPGELFVGPKRNGVIVPIFAQRATSLPMIFFRLEDMGTIIQEAWFGSASASVASSWGVLLMRNTNPDAK